MKLSKQQLISFYVDVLGYSMREVRCLSVKELLLDLTGREIQQCLAYSQVAA